MSTFYVADDTYPSPAYYDDMVQAFPGYPGVMFVPQPAGTTTEYGIVYCNIQGDDLSQTNITVGYRPGGQNAYLYKRILRKYF